MIAEERYYQGKSDIVHGSANRTEVLVRTRRVLAISSTQNGDLLISDCGPRFAKFNWMFREVPPKSPQIQATLDF